jgi:phosphate transport system substrate-binding protein
MNRKSLKIGVCLKWMMGALALTAASVSYASSTTLVGGGSTLPAPGYVGSGTGNPVTQPGSGSLFAAFNSLDGNPEVSYCETSYAVAQAVFEEGSNVQDTCPTLGFGAKAVGRTDLDQPDFVASEVPLTAAEYISYQNNHGDSAYPTQFPVLAATIAIAFNLTDDQGTQVTAANFSDGQLCDIFSGSVTNWSDPALASVFTLPAGHTVNQAINVVYRSDGSGTTFDFANHLTYACSGTSSAHFIADPAFTNVVSLYEPTIPSNWLGESGNAAVDAAIQQTSASIGYVETANTVQAVPAISIADVDGSSPTANFDSKLTVTASDLAFNSVINGANSATGQAVVSTIASVISGNNTSPSTQCIALVNPAEYAVPSTSATTTMLPEGAYPIVAISYLLANAQDNGADLTNVRALLEAPYNSTIQASSTDIGGSTGLQFLTLAKGSFTATQVGDCAAN